MAKFKRFDPRNKKAESKHRQFGESQSQKRSRLIAQQTEGKRSRNEKNFYTFEEELDL